MTFKHPDYSSHTHPLLHKVDCVRLYVPDTEAGLAFYRDQLGHALIWRTEHAIGLCLPETDTEPVRRSISPSIRLT
jgi:hypothetical protein